MKKQIIRLFFLLICLSVIKIVSADTYRCTASKLNIRETAEQSGKIIGHILQNETVDILSINNGWGTVLVNEDTGYVSMNYMKPVQSTLSEEQNVNDEPWTDKQKAIFWLCFAIAVGLYAFAVVKVKKGEMVVIKGWLDFGLLIFPWLVVSAHFWDAVFGHMIFGKYVLIALYVIAGICLIASLVLTFIANWGKPFYLIFALIMKLVVIPIMAFGVFYLVYKIWDKRGINYKSILIFAILGILIGGLMSFDD